MTIFVALACGKCGIEFQVPAHFERECREEGDKKTWYCPNGHPRIFGEREADKLKRERDRAIQDQARLSDELAWAKRRTTEEMEARQKAERTAARIRKRAAAAMCPCCNRHFSNVERHMKTKHPDVVKLTPKTA